MDNAATDAFFSDPGPANKNEPPRHPRDGRYMLPDVGGDKDQPRTRATTLAKTLEDTYHLDKWTSRMTAFGLSRRPDLLALLHTIDDPSTPDAKKLLNEIVDKSKEQAGAGAGANHGTALHAFTEQLMHGKPLSDIPEQYHRDLMAYRSEMARHGLIELPRYAERTCLNEDFNVAGRFDRILQTADGHLVIGDLKTQRTLDFGDGAIAIQLAIYARSRVLRDFENGTWEQMPPVQQDYALVIHLPVGEGRCEIKRINLHVGYWGAKLAAETREFRKVRTMSPYQPRAVVQGVPAPQEYPEISGAGVPPAVEQLALQANAAVADQVPSAAAYVAAHQVETGLPSVQEVDNFLKLLRQAHAFVAEQGAVAAISWVAANPTADPEMLRAMRRAIDDTHVVTESRVPEMVATAAVERAAAPASGFDPDTDIETLMKRFKTKPDMQGAAKTVNPAAKLERNRINLAKDMVAHANWAAARGQVLGLSEPGIIEADQVQAARSAADDQMNQAHDAAAAAQETTVGPIGGRGTTEWLPTADEVAAATPPAAAGFPVGAAASGPTNGATVAGAVAVVPQSVAPPASGYNPFAEVVPTTALEDFTASMQNAKSKAEMAAIWDRAVAAGQNTDALMAEGGRRGQDLAKLGML